MQPEITSVSNPKVKWLVGLRKPAHRRAKGVAVIDGYPEVELALRVGVVPRVVVCAPDLVTEDARFALLEQAAQAGAEVLTMSAAAFAKAAYRENPDGFLAVVPAPVTTLADLELPAEPLLLVCEAIEKPGNLGAMLRTAEALGIDAVIAASPVTDFGNPNVVRASKGTVFAVPTAAASAVEVADWLADNRIRIVVATPEADLDVVEVALTGPVAIVVGAEHAGVTDFWRDRADVRARIPMAGTVNSLNVATCAALVLYEARRQRSATA